MDDEERKQASRRLPSTQPNQVSSDSTMAMALQQQERALTMLTTIESENDDDDDNDDESDEVSDETFNNEYEYFQSHDFEGELDFLEEQESYTDDEMDDDDIDVDELTYEELIALGEFIGEEKRGLSLNEIPRCLHPCKSTSVGSKSGLERCVVCQVEYEEGESVVALPCEHPYHSECISKWLQVKKICPICSTEVSPP